MGALLLAGLGLRAEPGMEDGPGFGPESGMSDGQREKRFDAMEKELGLSKEQSEKLRAHRKAQRETGMALMQEMKAKREALRAELDKPTLDTSKVKALNEELKALHNKMADHRLTAVLELREILTPEQFKKFQAKAQERRGQWEKNRGGRRGAGMGEGSKRGPKSESQQ